MGRKLTVEINVSGVLTTGTLPEGKGVYHDDVRGANDSVTGSVGELVP
jgi:hypothetical protein